MRVYLSMDEYYFITRLLEQNDIIGIDDHEACLSWMKSCSQETWCNVKQNLLSKGYIQETRVKTLVIDEAIHYYFTVCIEPRKIIIVKNFEKNNENKRIYYLNRDGAVKIDLNQQGLELITLYNQKGVMNDLEELLSTSKIETYKVYELELKYDNQTEKVLEIEKKEISHRVDGIYEVMCS